MFNKIIVGLDGSKAADKALAYACDLAKKYDSALHLINSPREETAALVFAGYGGFASLSSLPLETHFDEVGQKIIDKATKDAAELGVTVADTHVKIGSPSEAILELAESLEADLIVTGRRGLGSLSSLFLGSTSQHIANNAKCACLTVA